MGVFVVDGFEMDVDLVRVTEESVASENEETCGKKREGERGEREGKNRENLQAPLLVRRSVYNQLFGL